MASVAASLSLSSLALLLLFELTSLCAQPCLLSQTVSQTDQACTQTHYLLQCSPCSSLSVAACLSLDEPEASLDAHQQASAAFSQSLSSLATWPARSELASLADQPCLLSQTVSQTDQVVSILMLFLPPRPFYDSLAFAALLSGGREASKDARQQASGASFELALLLRSSLEQLLLQSEAESMAGQLWLTLLTASLTSKAGTLMQRPPLRRASGCACRLTSSESSSGEREVSMDARQQASAASLASAAWASQLVQFALNCSLFLIWEYLKMLPS